MSTVVKKILVLTLALLLSFAFVGCAEEKPAQEEEAQAEIEQIVASAAIATAEVDTYKFSMDMPVTIEIVGGAESGKITMAIEMAGAVDNANKEMQMMMNMAMDIPGQGKQDMAMEYYFVGEWMYMKIDIPGMGEQWMKMRLTEELWEAQSQIASQVALLETAVEVNLVGSENMSGTACYVIEIVPNMEALIKLLSQQPVAGIEDIDLEELNLVDLFKEMSVKQWIAKDSYLLMKSEVHMLMEMRPGDVGATEEDLEKMTMDVNIQMELYEHNQPVSIKLPQEALEAQEIPGS